MGLYLFNGVFYLKGVILFDGMLYSYLRGSHACPTPPPAPPTHLGRP